jgi:hypothetical protein
MITLLRIIVLLSIFQPLVRAEVIAKKIPVAKGVPQLESLRSNVSKALGESIYSGPASSLYYTGEYFLEVCYRMPKVTHLTYLRASDPTEFVTAYKARDQKGLVLAKLKDIEIQELLSRHAVDSTGAKLSWKSHGENRWLRNDGNLAKYDVVNKQLIIVTKKQSRKLIGF